jgi:hypothetical protein
MTWDAKYRNLPRSWPWRVKPVETPGFSILAKSSGKIHENQVTNGHKAFLKTALLLGGLSRGRIPEN